MTLRLRREGPEDPCSVRFADPRTCCIVPPPEPVGTELGTRCSLGVAVRSNALRMTPSLFPTVAGPNEFGFEALSTMKQCR